jgi:hypothetical protein
MMAQEQIELEQRKIGYEVARDIQPSWQVKYNDYGSMKIYLKVRNIYWNISDYYLNDEGRYTATNFPLAGYDPETTKLLKQFRKDLSSRIYLEND